MDEACRVRSGFVPGTSTVDVIPGPNGVEPGSAKSGVNSVGISSGPNSVDLGSERNGAGRTDSGPNGVDAVPEPNDSGPAESEGNSADIVPGANGLEPGSSDYGVNSVGIASELSSVDPEPDQNCSGPTESGTSSVGVSSELKGASPGSAESGVNSMGISSGPEPNDSGPAEPEGSSVAISPEANALEPGSAESGVNIVGISYGPNSVDLGLEPNGSGPTESRYNGDHLGPELNDLGPAESEVCSVDTSPGPGGLEAESADSGVNSVGISSGPNSVDSRPAPNDACPTIPGPNRVDSGPKRNDSGLAESEDNSVDISLGANGLEIRSAESEPNIENLRSEPNRSGPTESGTSSVGGGSELKDVDPGSVESGGSSDFNNAASSGFYRPPPMRSRQQNRDGGNREFVDASVPTVPTFQQFILQQVRGNAYNYKNKESHARQNVTKTDTRLNKRSDRNEHPQRMDQAGTARGNRRNQNAYVRLMTCDMLADISRSESVAIIEKVNRQKESFNKLLETAPDVRNQDVFALVFELVANVWKSSFEESKKLLLLEICNSKFIDHLQLYLMQLPYIEGRWDKSLNKRYWTKEKEFWSNFMTFCECIIDVSPATAVRKCGALIEATSKTCLDGLKEKHEFELPPEYTDRMIKIRESLRKQTQNQKKNAGAMSEPPESFRQLSLLPTAEELLGNRPYLRPNVVEGSYSDVEHYLDVQFRLLREDCFGPLREGIRQYTEDPKKRRYDHIRMYRNVKFMEPYFSKQKIGSLVLLDHYTEKMIKKINWKQSKRFLFGSLVLFTKDNCRSFLVGTILERDEEYLSKRLLGVSIMDSTLDFDLYNDDVYTMIECEVYFEPYHHVLKALQDRNFPEQLAMSKYIVNVQKEPENPAYLTPHTVYAVRSNDDVKVGLATSRNEEAEAVAVDLSALDLDANEIEFSVLQDKTWPSQTQLGLDGSQYEAYKLALTHEFAVIQGPPGTGKTFLGVKVAKTLLDNAPFSKDTCSLLVICYTNHALDQFLEALLPITNSIVRIGGRSQSKLLEQHNITNLRGRYSFHQRYILENRIRELKAVHEACLATDVLLSYDTIAKFAKECESVKKFYQKQSSKVKKDVLRHWLFEDADSCVEFQPLLGQHVQNKVTEDKHEIVNVDDDIYARDDLELDNLNEEDPWSDRFPTSDIISFSLPEAEKELNTLVNKYNQHINIVNTQEDNGENPDFLDQILQELESEIVHLHSQIKVFKDMMVYCSRAPRIKLADVKDLSAVPRIERWSLYFKWARIAKTYLKKEVKVREKKVQSAAEAYEEARMIADVDLLQETRVIGMTTSAAARLRKLLVEIEVPIVVVEEAAEVLEAHIVTSLTEHCQHLILIGDHQQLRPSAAYMRMARQYNLEVSLFERMILNGVHSRRLGVQHRMRPEIAALVSPHIYPDLKNHPSVETFPPVRGVAHNLFFISHSYMEQEADENSSRTNTQEADFTLRLANYLMQQGYKPDEVTIVAAYSGQMFYMRRQRSLYDHLAEVKITVLDNYQGEESKIILLSLVRNNTNDSIGFLGTENRICVALSRAREGFFIFGNIDLLKRNSTLWTNIAETLASNRSLGTSLNLKCQNHDGKITTIASLEDFVKVPEGGCQLDCKYKLPACGHPCPRVCHTYDLAHANIQCTRDCERKICEIEGHNCPLSCGTECKPCWRLLDKLLPCGHTRPVRCFMGPDDPSIYCHVDVTVRLPDCGHQAIKPCSMKVSDVNCKEKCENNRLNCGHACIWNCHARDDPDHERYACPKPCARAKKGCTANLEGDLGEHKCLQSCSEACIECDVQVVKKRSGCKHYKRIACHENVDITPCREKCARSLPCGHHCKKLCYQTCGDCQQKVKKTIPDCGHEIELECRMEPTRELCMQKCERVMACGHVCPARCGRPCDSSTCTELTDNTAEAPCGHTVRLPCDVHQAMQAGTVAASTLLKYCTSPCGVVLRCGHSCGGSCSGCRQGRLHAPCSAVCHQLNICGHQCQEPCSQVCPPCRRRCGVKCPHSPCGKLCGAPCTPCTEAECGRACVHSRCSRACGVACSRAPCDRACPLKLRCGHPCRGLCGEPCPPVCRVCDPDNFPTDLLGDPYEDDAKLVQLQDCPHILDVDTLDTLMNSHNETIKMKTCPFCREPIVNTYRYKDFVNKMLKYDINPIKAKVYGTEQQRSKLRLEILTKIKGLGQTQKLARENKCWSTAYNAIQYAVQQKQKNKSISVLHLDMYQIYIDLLVTVGEYYTKFVAENLTELKTEMLDHVELICKVLVASKQKISQQQQADIGKELKRMNSIIQLSKILGISKHSTKLEVVEAAKMATEAVLAWRVFDEENAVECLKKFEDAVEVSGIASKEERAMIVRAIGLKAGHWYKCPNGHFYCIADCGGAMVLSTCPDCGAAIGGQKHKLTAGNQHAGEMDGSRFAAWPTEAQNMANYRFD